MAFVCVAHLSGTRSAALSVELVACLHSQSNCGSVVIIQLLGDISGDKRWVSSGFCIVTRSCLVVAAFRVMA